MRLIRFSLFELNLFGLRILRFDSFFLTFHQIVNRIHCFFGFGWRFGRELFPERAVSYVREFYAAHNDRTNDNQAKRIQCALPLNG